VAGIDADELFDTRELVCQVQDMIQQWEGNPAFSNLPWKFNIAIGGSRQPVHAEINDLALFPPKGAGEQGNWGPPGDKGTGEQFERQFGFNVIVGGFFPPNVAMPFPSMPG